MSRLATMTMIRSRWVSGIIWTVSYLVAVLSCDASRSAWPMGLLLLQMLCPRVGLANALGGAADSWSKTGDVPVLYGIQSLGLCAECTQTACIVRSSHTHFSLVCLFRSTLGSVYII